MGQHTLLTRLLYQMGTNKCASQSGMTAYGTRRHLYDPKNQILPPMDHSTISLQMGTNKCASQVSPHTGLGRDGVTTAEPCSILSFLPGGHDGSWHQKTHL